MAQQRQALQTTRQQELKLSCQPAVLSLLWVPLERSEQWQQLTEGLTEQLM